MTAADTLTAPESSVAEVLPAHAEAPPLRAITVGLAGAAAFGLASSIGHGPAAMLRGAWMSPALFVGGALLATPPLYLAVTHAGEHASAERVLREVTSVVGDVGLVLLGLAAPAAYFSATLRTGTAPVLLAAAVALVGAVAVRVVARRSFVTVSPRVNVASFVWTLLALALGVRLLTALARQL